MKRINLLLSILLTSSALFSQVEIHDITNQYTTVNGLVVDAELNWLNPKAFFSKIFYIVNTSDAPQNLTFSRKIINSSIINNNNVYEGVNTDDACYLLQHTTIGTVWSVNTTWDDSIESQDSIFFRLFIAMENNTDAHVLNRYYVIDNDNNEIIDSVDVQINAFLEVKNETINFNVYPNPVNDVLNISISENNTSISIYDVIGKTVSEMELINGNNILNIENLNAGVYFYSIKRNGVSIETKQLVIK